MKIKDLRSLSKEDLQKKMIELRRDLIKENAQIATGTTPKNPGKVRNMKKTIAKILTLLNQDGGKTKA
jgi:large subunit ribosomal protein L29